MILTRSMVVVVVVFFVANYYTYVCYVKLRWWKKKSIFFNAILHR